MIHQRVIQYDRESRDYRMELDGRCVGYRATYSQADHALDELVYDMLSDDMLSDDCPDHGPYGDDDCPKCSCGMPATLVVHVDHTNDEVCQVCFERDYENNDEESRGWEVDPIDEPRYFLTDPTGETPLLVDILQVLDLALGSTHGAASVVAELRRIRARIEQVQDCAVTQG